MNEDNRSTDKPTDPRGPDKASCLQMALVPLGAFIGILFVAIALWLGVAILSESRWSWLLVGGFIAMGTLVPIAIITLLVRAMRRNQYSAEATMYAAIAAGVCLAIIAALIMLSQCRIAT